jgi:hypothetical protein
MIRKSACLQSHADIPPACAGKHGRLPEATPLPETRSELVSEQAHEVAYRMKTPKVTRQKALEAIREIWAAPRKGDGLPRQDISATGLADGPTPSRRTRST